MIDLLNGYTYGFVFGVLFGLVWTLTGVWYWWPELWQEMVNDLRGWWK